MFAVYVGHRLSRRLYVRRHIGRGTTNCSPVQVTVGKNVQEMLENALSLELEGLPVSQQAIVLCLEQADTGTRELLEHLLVRAEAHHAAGLKTIL